MLVVGHDPEVVLCELFQPGYGVGQSTDIGVLEESRGYWSDHIHARISLKVDKVDMSNFSPGRLFFFFFLNPIRGTLGNGINKIIPFWLALRLSGTLSTIAL